MKQVVRAPLDSAANERETHNRQVAYRAALESIVLLKNDSILPLESQRVALYGAGARHTLKGGTGSGDLKVRHTVSIYEGLVNAGVEVTTGAWLDRYDAEFESAVKAWNEACKKSFRRLQVKKIFNLVFQSPPLALGGPITAQDIADSGTDTCIYVLARQAGENADRADAKGDYYWADEELAHLRACTAHYAKTILVLNSGAPVDMAPLEDIPGIGAVVYFCQQGVEGGTALANLLTGRESPSGRLASTWPMRYEDIPFSQEFGQNSPDPVEQDYKEDIYVGYRYFDTFNVEPRFAFGYGLSYSSFAIEPIETAYGNGVARLRVKVQNTGGRPAREVVQVYASCPATGLAKEYQRLVAFGKTRTLAPGESEALDIAFGVKELASYRETDASFVLEAGGYVLRVGNCSRSTQAACVLEAASDLVVSTHKNICPRRRDFERLQAPTNDSPTPVGLPRHIIRPETVSTVHHQYPKPGIYHDTQVDAIMNRLANEDKIEVVVANGFLNSDRKIYLPGSIGDTTSKLYGKGLINISVCDGPAGIRLQRISAMDKKGKVRPMDPLADVFNYLPDFIQKRMYGNAETDQLMYQYTTAFPVGSALAQSWNPEILEEVGRAVSAEMEEYGVTFWLAPAINIHRNPLCGRNFEYFSEDPLLTGRLAAALVRGAQKVPGQYVTVKHFACNNQEFNRFTVSANVSERALREIYLRGFEYTVTEGGAKGFMTSLNRINGVYASNSHDLCTDVLRNEWGFDGVVMTDWYATKKGTGDNALAMRAGNDLLMPGGKYYRKALKKALRDGSLRPEDLTRCCANIVKSIVHSRVALDYSADMFD